MYDIIRWYTKDIEVCVASIESHEAKAKRYEAEAERVADPEVQSYMRHWAERERQNANEERNWLTELKRRLENVGG